jgi:glycine cleavage system H lipoate-binding protein
MFFVVKNPTLTSFPIIQYDLGNFFTSQFSWHGIYIYKSKRNNITESAVTVLLAIITLIVLVFADMLKQKNKKENGAYSGEKLHNDTSTSVIERYIHPGHCWALLQSHEPVIVGVDDFSQRLIGKLDIIDLPPNGSFVNQGEPFLTLHRGFRSLTHVAPVSGTIEKVNKKLFTHPSKLNHSPYEKGWVVKITPTNLEHDLRNLMSGSVAERWRESVHAQLLQWFAPHLGTVLQDGGTPVDNISDLLSDEEWRELTAIFFPSLYHTTFKKGAIS